jgi:hypothetical protein
LDDDIIRVRDQYYILSTSSLTDDRVRVLKEEDAFAVCDRRGDIEPIGYCIHRIRARLQPCNTDADDSAGFKPLRTSVAKAGSQLFTKRHG